jgi:hypothetical protein
VVVIWVFIVALDAILRANGVDGVGIGSCDVATSMGALGCVNRVWGLSWGRWGGVGGGMGPCSWWGCWGGFIEYMMHSEECVRTTSCTSICWAVDSVCMSFTAW